MPLVEASHRFQDELVSVASARLDVAVDATGVCVRLFLDAPANSAELADEAVSRRFIFIDSLRIRRRL